MQSVRVPGSDTRSVIKVTFSELPVKEWHALSNEAKNRYGISKGAGVSIVRAGREIDHGWYFMGEKRRENYDDWWRCEVDFEPVLDELFGITHTKQKINPTDVLNEILTPHLEAAAHQLNARVRHAFTKVHAETIPSEAGKRAEATNGILDPPRRSMTPAGRTTAEIPTASARRRVTGLKYRLRKRELDVSCFFVPSLVKDRLQLDLNVLHAFYEKVYGPLVNAESAHGRNNLQAFELLLLAFARAECTLKRARDRAVAKRLREHWGKTLAAFLE